MRRRRGLRWLWSAGKASPGRSFLTARAGGAEPFSRHCKRSLATECQLSRVIVGTGPGSYNGIRSAIAVAWGVSAARTIPLIGISSLLGLDEAIYCAVGDARRGQYYFACVGDGNFIAEPELLEESQIADALKRFPHAPVFAPAPIEFVPGLVVRTPSAVRLARLAADWTPNFPQPIYLKAPHITTPRQKRGSLEK